MNADTVRVAIAGAGGRMGRQLIQAADGIPGVKLTVALGRHGSSSCGMDAGTLAGLPPLGLTVTTEADAQADAFDVLVDFTRPAGLLAMLEVCLRHNKALVTGTTGLDETARAALQRAAEQIPIVFSANFSIGVNVMLRVLEKVSAVMGDYCDIEIVEAHHRHKVDAPSGTALAMGETIARATGRDLQTCAVWARHGHTGERPAGAIGFATLRAGDIVGEHTAIFADIGERLEISHRASSRMTFASGALHAARWVMQQPPGLYSMTDVLALDKAF